MSEPSKEAKELVEIIGSLVLEDGIVGSIGQIVLAQKALDAQSATHRSELAAKDAEIQKHCNDIRVLEDDAADKDKTITDLTRQRDELETDNSKLEQQMQLVEDAIPTEFEGSEETFGSMVSAIVRQRDEALKDSERMELQVCHLLDHCPDAECSTCSEIVCPFKDPFHFHHDGCPSCAIEAAMEKSK